MALFHYQKAAGASQNNERSSGDSSSEEFEAEGERDSESGDGDNDDGQSDEESKVDDQEYQDEDGEETVLQVRPLMRMMQGRLRKAKANVVDSTVHYCISNVDSVIRA